MFKFRWNSWLFTVVHKFKGALNGKPTVEKEPQVLLRWMKMWIKDFFEVI